MTIAVFPLIFPAGIVLSIVAYQFVHPYVLVDLSVLSPEEYGTTALATVFSATERPYDLNLIKVSPLEHAKSVPYTVVLWLATHDRTTAHDQIVTSSELLSEGQPDRSVVLGGDQAAWSASVTVRDSPNLSLQWLGAASEAAFTTAELVREGFISVIQLDPLDDTLYNFYQNLNKHYSGSHMGLVKCQNSGAREISAGADAKTLVSKGFLECSGDSVLGVLFTKAPDFSITGNVRSSGAGWKRIPVGPFFLCLRGLYYATGYLLT